MPTTNVQTAIGVRADGTTDLEDAPVAAQLERHETMPLFVPAPAGEELADDVARAVASTWHGGQFTAFYAFASSGHFDRDDLSHELSRTIAQSYHGATEADRLALDMFGTYILNR